MNQNFCYSFPAIKGRQAGKEYYIAMCPLKIIPKLFLFNEEELPPEFRAQRVLNKSRIPEITSYIIDNPSDYVFSSITSSIDGEVDFVPITPENEANSLGTLQISMEARFLINDGQHRRAAIEEAIKVHPELGNETISVVFFLDQGLQKSQQIFADLNKHAVNTTKSIGILFDSRDPLAIATKKVLDKIPFLKSYTDRERSSLPKYSAKIFALSNIYSTNAKLLSKKYGDIITLSDEDFLLQFWQTLCTTMKEWQFVKEKKISPTELRDNYVNSYGVVLEALGLLGHYLYQNKINEWTIYLSKLGDIDWTRDNPLWSQSVIASNGRIHKNTNSVRATYILIKNLIDIP